MYVIIANGFSGIVDSKEELDLISNIFPYPKFRKMRTKAEALEFLQKYKRRNYKPNFHRYGEVDYNNGFARIKYFIEKNTVYCNVDISKLGNVVFLSDTRRSLSFDNHDSYIKLVISNLILNDRFISSHCVAIAAILNAIGDVIDVDIIVPDISVYLAINNYNRVFDQKNPNITSIFNRLGGVSFTIE